MAFKVLIIGPDCNVVVTYLSSYRCEGMPHEANHDGKASARQPASRRRTRPAPTSATATLTIAREPMCHAEASMTKAAELGWTVVSMKDDWNTVYGRLSDGE